MAGSLTAITIGVATGLSLVLSGSAIAAKAKSTRPGDAATATRPAQQDDAAEVEKADNKNPIPFEWLPFPDKEKFTLLGLHWFSENKPKLWRMPKGQIDALPKGVAGRCKVSSGARILIRSNTANLGLRVAPAGKGSLKGFDVYVDGKLLRSVVAENPGVEFDLVLFRSLDRKDKEIVVYLPCHQELTITSIGVDKGAKFDAPQHKFARPLPVVFYGSSVCQGNGASKPGMTYEAIVCRELNLDFVNLGFGGAGKAERNVVDLVSSIPASCYVFDLGKSYGTQDKTAYKDMLLAVRKAHPDTPIICITPITSAKEVKDESYSARSVHTRTVMREAFNEVLASGDKNLFLVEGADLLGFNEHDGLSKDGVHPSERGYGVIARKLSLVMKKAMGL